MPESQTSERVTPEDFKSNLSQYLIYLMHERSYAFAGESVRGKRALDFGCGDGYGCHYLSEFARHVTGVDVAKETLEEARIKYASENITWMPIEPVEDSALPFADDAFDVVLSFQVIEHLMTTEPYLREIRRVLRPGGKFYCATPNARIRLLPFQNPWNKFHVREFASEELRALLESQFVDVELHGLTLKEPWLARERRRTDRFKWMLWPVTNKLIPDGLRHRLLHLIWDLTKEKRLRPGGRPAGPWPTIDDAIIVADAIERAPNLMAVCRNHHENS